MNSSPLRGTVDLFMQGDKRVSYSNLSGMLDISGFDNMQFNLLRGTVDLFMQEERLYSNIQ